MKKVILLFAALMLTANALADTRCIKRLDPCDVSKYNYNISHWIEQGNLRTGESMYGEENVPIASLSPKLKGLDWIQTSFFSKRCSLDDVALFQIGCDGEVLVLHSREIKEKPEWLSSFKRTKLTLTNAEGEVFEAFSRRFRANDTVHLGPNGDKDKSMYLVAVRPSGKVPAQPAPAGYVLDAVKRGAVADGKTVNTSVLQACIDECSARENGGTVRIDGGVFVSGTLVLKDNVTLWVEQGSILRASADPKDFPAHRVSLPSFRGKEDFQFIFANKAKNIGISGGGIIDGYSLYEGYPWRGKDNEWERPRLIRMVECEDIAIKHITLIRSANWTQYYEACRNLDMEEITVRCYTGTHNQDGLDLSGCSNVRVRNFLGCCGDDVICLKALSMVRAENVRVENVRSRYANCNIVKIGTETHGDIRNVHIKDVEGWARYSIAIESVDGSNIDGVTYEDVRMHWCASPFVVRLGNRGRTFEGGPVPAPAGSIKNVVLRNIRNDDIGWVEKKTGPGVAACIAGIRGHRIENVLVENCDLLLFGSISDPHYIYRGIPENESKYPEFDCVGITPSYGIYVRHADNVTLRNVRIRMKNHDIRPAIVLEDASGYSLENLDYETCSRTIPGPVWDKTADALKQ